MFIVRSKYETSLLPRLAAPLVAGLLLSAAYNGNAHAAPSTYVVSDQEGYGVTECLAKRSDCGKIVADAWCESHGHGPARAYGRAEDMTASIAADDAPGRIETDATVIACAE